jgi:hypothetical protein
VDCAQSPDEVATIDRDDFAVAECVGQGVERVPVIRVVKDRHQHAGVCDVEIGVAGGQALLAKNDRPRHGNFDDFQLKAILVSCSAQAAEIGCERFVVGIILVGLNNSDYRLRRDKARDVVNVTVGIVAGDAALQPNHVGDAEIVVKGGFDLLSRSSGIALLHVAEQAFFGSDQGAATVDVNAAAFEDEWFAVELRVKLADAESLRDA